MRYFHRGKWYEVQGKKNVRALLRDLRINPEAVLVIDHKSGELLTEDRVIPPDGEIEIIRVTASEEWL